MNDREHVIIISSTKTSANYAVAYTILVERYNECFIHHLYFSDKKEMPVESYNYSSYPIFNKRKAKINEFERVCKNKAIKRIFLSLYYRVANIYDNLFTTQMERECVHVIDDLINKYSIKEIFSTNNPIYAHKVLLSLSKLKCNVKLTALWLDPYLMRYQNGGFFWRYSASKLENKLFFITDHIYSLPETFKNDSAIIPHEYKHIVFEIPFIKEKKINNITKDIIFAGSFVPGLREPEIPFAILLNLLPIIDSDIRFVFYINCPSKYMDIKTRSNGRISINAYISREELELRISQAYMLISIGNINSSQMPSKVVEYISYRKPIIYFQFEENDPSVRYFDCYPDVCRIKSNWELITSVENLASFLVKEHKEIRYEDLISVPLYQKSTPKYVSNLLLQY